jgi:MGT family glycosyltransferase
MSMSAFSGRLPLYLVGNLRELDYGRRDLPPSVHYLGPLQWHPPEEPGTAAWLDAVPAVRPWVHVTEGTSHYQDPFLLRAAAIGLAGEPLEAILTTGGKRDPASIVAAPAANVHVTRWLSHGELLPRCAAVVTTGGPATIMAALVAGVPLVVVPTTWDKPDNARRVVEAGVGIRLAPKRCTPQGLRDAVREVLLNPAYGTRARQAAKNLAAAPGPDGAVELLEDLVGDNPPIRQRRLQEETACIGCSRHWWAARSSPG